MRRTAAWMLVLTAVLVGGCGDDDDNDSGTAAPVVIKGPPPQAPPTLLISSTAFTNGGTIPAKFTCDGDDSSPPLRFASVPPGTAELALLVEDPDAPGGTFVHWSVWGIAPSVTSVGAGAVPPDARQGENSFGAVKYNGPCPPKGADPHRYQFLLYALKTPLGLDEGAKPNEVLAAIAKRATALGETYATFGR